MSSQYVQLYQHLGTWLYNNNTIQLARIIDSEIGHIYSSVLKDDNVIPQSTTARSTTVHLTVGLEGVDVGMPLQATCEECQK